MNLLDVSVDFDVNVDGLYMVQRQEVTDDLLATLRSERIASSTIRAKDYHKVADIPTGVVEVWLRQGRPFYEAPAREVLRWLRNDGLDAFIATNKRI